jgi:tetratricopeptide (TPR) repeat protein
MDFVAVGDAVNRASRLQAAAPAEGVLLSADSYRHVRGLYVAREVEPLRLKGVAEPVPAVLVTAARPRTFRIPMRGVEGVPTRTVGRDAELAQLKAAFEDVAEERHPRVVTVEADAGVGKSRLLAELGDWLDLLPAPVWYFRGRAAPGEQSRPFALLRSVVTDRLQLTGADTAEAVETKLADALEAASSDGDAGPKAQTIARVLGFAPNQQASRTLSDDVAGPRQRALEHLAGYLRRLAHVNPVVVLLEDLHWADDASLDALATVTAQLAGAPVLVVATARPSLRERRPHWGEGIDGHVVVTLAPLTRKQSRDLLADVLRHVDEVPAGMSDLVVDAAEGNPFYLEEMVKWLVEVGVIDTAGPSWQVRTERLTALDVPPTLRAVLQARVDALDERERAVLQRAAVVGRVFWVGAVRALGERSGRGVPVPGDRVEPTLDRLRQREVVFRRERSAFTDDVEFTFKHALLRDVTYDSLLREQRRHLHAEVASWLQDATGAAGRSDEYAGLIAEHLEAAGDETGAGRWYVRAGRAASASSASREAVGLLDRAHALADGDDELRVDALLALAAALDVVGDVAREEQVLDELQAASAASQDPARSADVLLARASWAFRRSRYEESESLATQAVSLADDAGDLVRGAAARLWRGRALTWRGQHRAARGSLQDALLRAREAGDAIAVAESLRYLAIVASNVSDTGAAQDLLHEALRTLHEAGAGDVDRAKVLAQLGAVLFNAQLLDEAIGPLEQARRTFALAGFRYGEAVCAGNLATIAASRGELHAALRRAEDALAVVRDIEDREGVAITLGVLGDVHRQVGQREQARRRLEESVRIAGELEFHYVESDSLLLLALVALDEGRPQDALPLAERSLALARVAESRLGECRSLQLQGWGHLAAGGSDLSAASDSFAESRELAESLGLAALASEAAAGKASAELARGDVPAAARHAAQVVADPPTDGGLVPSRALLAVLRVYEAAGDRSGSEQVRELARTWLDQRVRRVDDPVLVTGLLDDVPATRELAQAAGYTPTG